MKRVWGHVLAGLSLLATGAVGFSACVHNDSTIFIRNVLAPQYSQAGSLCVFTPDPMQTFISSGVLDISLRTQYDAEFLVGNQMIAQVNPSQLQTETSSVTIQGAIVRITDSAGVQLKTFTRLTSASLFPATGTTPGYTPIGVTIIDGQTIQQDPRIWQDLRSARLGNSGSVRLVTYVRFFGRSLGGQSLESDEFEFPVDVCNGCLVGFTNNTSLPGFQTPNCIPLAGSATSTTQARVPCAVGQDLSVDCSLVCGDIPTCATNTFSSGGVDGGTG